MTTETAEQPILQKTRELCQTLLTQPEFKSIRTRIDAFMSNEAAKLQYQCVMEKGENLQHKQQMGVALTEQEITEFQKDRDALVNNSVARNFIDAQQEMHKVQESVGQYVAKTFELGRVPTEDDFDSGSCGHGCGCHH